MEKRKILHKQMIREVEAFRARQKQALEDDQEIKKNQYREIQQILSPFWAWRMH